MRSRRSVTVSVLLVISSLLLPAGPVAADLCGDVQLIHVRGTGDPVNDDFYPAGYLGTTPGPGMYTRLRSLQRSGTVPGNERR
jgi:hypothetical protein